MVSYFTNTEINAALNYFTFFLGVLTGFPLYLLIFCSRHIPLKSETLALTKLKGCRFNP